jgi:adenine-specific DNA-methyltransferase
MSKYDDLVKKLKEIFQIDRPELDFGIYRIFNARAAEIKHYLENRLKEKVRESLSVSGEAKLNGLSKELREKEAQYRADGIDPDTVPKVREIREQLSQYGDSAVEHENSVFSHLLTFFSRYYDKGDFISQRRYKGDTYAIPYAGEEVVLHWANKDQYYIKSSESFANYAFKLDNGRTVRTVRFRLVTADTAKDNRKDNDKERRFVLIEPHSRSVTDDDGETYEDTVLPVTEENNADGQELVLRFEYRAMPKGNPGSKQDKLVNDAVETILSDDIVKTRWLDLSQRAPTEKNPQRTLLEKHLTQYTTRNTADYFIHKNLGGFLRNELDFYIKNEVMHLDDVQHAETFAAIEKNLRQIQTLRAIALDLIDFLAQLEDFQKKLWLKKKFVTAAHYCLTLDRVPQSLYSAIAENQQQWTQWEQLGMLAEDKTDLFNQAEAGSVDYLQAHPYLMVDTALFDAAFKQQLLAAIDHLDDNLDGLLIHGDNFQALNLLQERYREQVKCVYIDPPYNTGGDGFGYKDNYKRSSWLSNLDKKLHLAKSLQSANSSFCSSIDDNEVNSLSILLTEIYGEDNKIADLVWQKRYSPDVRTAISDAHEYILIYAMDSSVFKENRNLLPLGEEQTKQFSNPDNDPRGPWKADNFTAPGFRANQMYEIEAPDGRILNPPPGRCWVVTSDRYENLRKDNRIIFGKDGNGRPAVKRFLNEMKGMVPWTWWDHQSSGHSQEGLKEGSDLFSRESTFATQKPVRLIQKLLHIISNSSAYVLDYFAGSGTTAHAVINLNREDNGRRKYILVEQGEYFDTVLKPRIQKVVYSADWKNGKATAHETGISHAFKVLKIESYEDALNNLQLKRDDAQQTLFDTLPESAKDDYLLRYMLEIESRGSLLSVTHFNKPFDCRLKVTVDSAGAYEERAIDLVETFNYLIGLRVKHVDMHLDQGFVTVAGWLPSGEKTLVLWRDVERVDYDQLKRLCDKLAINPADSEFEVVYINGDHNIPAVFTSTEAEGGITKTLKIRQIEAEFLGRMFAVDDV